MALPKEIKRTPTSIYIKSDVDCQMQTYKISDNSSELIDNYTFTADEGFYLFPVTEDGLYLSKIVGTVEDQEKTLAIFPTLISNIAKDFISFACDNCNDYLDDCGCSELDSLSKQTMKYNTLTSKILYLESYILNGNLPDERVLKHKDFILQALQSVSCKSEGLLLKIINEECVQGYSDNNELYRLLTIIRFLAIYLIETNNPDDFIEILDESIVISDLYSFDSWKDCICNTCLRIDELLAIYENGLVITVTPPTNLPPIAEDISREVSSLTNSFSYNLLQLDFSSVYDDENTAFPANIRIQALPSNYILEDTDSNPVNLPATIPYSEIGNYRVVYTYVSGTFYYSDFFTFRVDDGELVSPVYRFNIILIRLHNRPPTVIQDFELPLLSDTPTLIRKTILFTVGSVIDIDGDTIDLAKLLYSQQLDVELWDGAAYQPLANEGVITLANYTDTGEFLRVTYNALANPSPPPIRGLDIPLLRLAFHDLGSNKYSNEDNPANFMTGSFNLITAVREAFTGGFVVPVSVVGKNWIPLGRVEYDGAISDLVVELISQSGYTSAELPFIVVPATNNSPYDIYSNGASVINPATVNPPNNTYDILCYTDILNTRGIVFNVKDKQNYITTLGYTVTVENTGSSSTVPTLEMNFLEFDETDIADFDYLEVPATFPPDFLGTVPATVVPLDFTDIQAGQLITIASVGLIGFSISTPSLRNPRIFDNLGNDITNTVFKKFFDADKQLELYISYSVYTPASVYFKFEF